MTTTDPTLAAPAVPFSAALREATRDDHEQAETDGFLAALVGGRLGVDAYAQLAVQQWFVYAALERAAEAWADDPVAGRFVAPELTRVPAIEADLDHLLGADWAASVAPLPATAAYRDRIEVAASRSGPFVAHHYTRYLGDLSGGFFIGRALARTFDLDADRGLAFYAFPDIADPRAFKDRYRDELDAAPWTDDERREVIEEVRLAYALNRAVFTDLATATRGGGPGEDGGR